MPTTIIESFTQNPLQPAIFLDDARSLAGSYGPSLTLAKGTVLGKKTSDGKLYAYANANSDGTETAVGILMYDIKTDASNNVYFSDSSAVASASNPPNATAPYYIAGTFDTAELTGWDTAAATDLFARTLVGGFVRIP